MAVSSFPRPDPSSPNSVAQASFSTARKGFDAAEVRAFLGQVATEMNRLREREHQLEQSLLETKDARLGSDEGIDESTATRLLGEEAAHILQAARESAAMVKAKAEQGAASILSDATDEAARVRAEVDVESARRRSEAAADAEAQLRDAKQQGRDMVNEARAYRERVMGEMNRRRDLVRGQIDDLIRGREQLLTAFNAARDAADDVLSRIGPLGDAGTPYELPPAASVPDADLDAGVPAFDAEPSRPDDAEPTPVEDTDASVEVEPSAGAFFDQDAGPGAGAGDTGGGLAAPDGPEPDGPEPDGADDGRVVELFPDGTVHDVPGADDSGAPEQTSNVDNLFARLRADRVDDDELDTMETTEMPAVDDALGGQSTEAAVDADEPGGEESGDQSPFELRDAALTPLIVAAARRVKRVLADEQNEALDALRQGEPVRDVAKLVRDEVDRVARYADAIANELEAAATAGARSVDPEASPDVAHSGALGPVRDILATTIVSPLRERLERVVADGDGDNDVVTKRVRAVYREWKSQQVDDQLDDIFRLAYGRGALDALPAGTPVRWIVDPAGPACPDAEDNSLAGAVPAGEGFPTGHACAPAHSGCRCLLEPAPQ